MTHLAELSRVAPADPVPAGTPTGEPVIVTAGLETAYGRNPPVLRGVEMTVRQGERVALIGANGCGKSTLLKCLIGLHPATRGTVTTLGEYFEHAPRPAQLGRIRHRTGFVFQKHCLVQRRSVLSNVIHGMLGQTGSWRAFDHALAPDAWRRAALDALAKVNLADFAGRRADALSGGQQQRVAIARALIRQPMLLIADEPAASLDPVSGCDVMELFGRLCREHKISILFTSHDMDHARRFSDRTVALRAGRVFFDRPSRDVTNRDIEDAFRA